MKKLSKVLAFFLFIFSPVIFLNAETSFHQSFIPGKKWTDNNGVHINAHGGGIVYHNGKYYWFGEHKSARSFVALVGINCYSSTDLYNWQFESVALPVVDDENSPITKGAVMERPKVIYNEKTGKFVMYFHLELKGKGYEASQVGIAISDNVTGPYQLLKTSRVNAKKWPENMTKQQRKSKESFKQWWTPEFQEAVKNGWFVRRDFKGGQMNRDMTLFVDDDKKAYHIYSSEENLTLHIAELTDDYLDYTGKYIRVEPGGHNEAPAVFKKDGKYFMITSGCTGWEPNKARLLVADNMMGEWTLHKNPCRGKDAELTFRSQSTYVLPVQGKKNAFIYMGDRWLSRNLINSQYVWLPVLFENGLPVLKWMDEWDLSIFDDINPDNGMPGNVEGYKLVWNDEFTNDGAPDAAIWKHEEGFARNHEDQWYQRENAVCENGLLKIYAKKEKRPNPRYEEGSRDWRKNRENINYTASSINTRGTKEFKYGRFEVRAKIPTASGAWPAIWTLGVNMEWPSNGEIDIMEYYQVNNEPHILANTAWGTDRRYHAKWNSSKIPFTHFTDKDAHWADKFHVWRMDWDEETIRLYLDDELLNETFLKDTYNGSLGEQKNPFMQPHYILLNLALGGDNGGKIDDSAFPMVYEIDYVRVYQRK